MGIERIHIPRYTAGFADGIVTLATLPALAVGVAAYSFHVNIIRLVAWLFDENAKYLWKYFHHYLLILILLWILFLVVRVRRDRRQSLNRSQ
jgi:flagellar biosynthesis/type III secretory pathway M-ring protein FliF/YscJ